MNRTALKRSNKKQLIDLVLLQAERIEVLSKQVEALEQRLDALTRQSHRAAAPGKAGGFSS